MAAPRITLRCDCGAEALVAFGDRWTCESCGRTYDTAGIPEADFQAIQDLRRRYRIAGYTGVVLVAAFVLLLALTAQEFQLFIGLPFVLLVWFMYGSLAWGVFPAQPGVSWETHLAAALIGVTLAIALRRLDIPPRKRYIWEGETQSDKRDFPPTGMDHLTPDASQPHNPPRVS